MSTRYEDVGYDLTKPVKIYVTNQATGVVVELKHEYAPQPVTSLPTTGVPEGSTGYDTTGSKAVVWTGAAWEVVTSV
jgi:hypothetical protein